MIVSGSGRGVPRHPGRPGRNRDGGAARPGGVEVLDAGRFGPGSDSGPGQPMGRSATRTRFSKGSADGSEDPDLHARHRPGGQRGFLQRLAELGRNQRDRRKPEDRLDEVMDAVHRRIGTPVLTTLRLEQPDARPVGAESLVPGSDPRPVRLDAGPDSSAATVGDPDVADGVGPGRGRRTLVRDRCSERP